MSLPSGVSNSARSKRPAHLTALTQTSWAVPTYSCSVHPNTSASQPGRRYFAGLSRRVWVKMAAVLASAWGSEACQVICWPAILSRHARPLWSRITGSSNRL